MNPISEAVQQEINTTAAKHGVADLEIDESMVTYVVEMLRGMGEPEALISIDDLAPFLQQLTGDDTLSDEVATSLSLSLFKCVHGYDFGIQPDDGKLKVERELDAPVCAADLMVGNVQVGTKPLHESANPLPTVCNAPIAEGSEVGAKKKGSKAALARAARRATKKAEHKARMDDKSAATDEAEANEAAQWEGHDGEGEEEHVWSTNRFERFHKTWTGHSQWKVRGDAAALKIDELDDDDYSSAWLECLKLGIPWGGRGAGGRGVARITGETKDIHINNVTMARGVTQLLTGATLKLVQGHRYGLVGQNGVGKTTLLRRMALGTLPGMPPWMTVLHVEQELPECDDTSIDFVLRFDYERTRLLAEETDLLGEENEEEDDAALSITKADRLKDVQERLQAIDAWTAPDRAKEILRSLGLKHKQCDSPISQLSGGWRMRVALAAVLYSRPDVLLLDEPTNHLDLPGILWLQHFLCEYEGTVLFVSHDRNFLDVVCTDVIEMRKKQLTYFSGNYTEYCDMVENRRQGIGKRISAIDKQKQHMQSFVDKQRSAAKDQSSKGGDPKKQQQIKSRLLRMEKLDRFRTDGKKVKQSYAMHGTIAQDQADKPATIKLNACMPLPSSTGAIIELRSMSLQYPNTSTRVLDSVEAQVWQHSKVAIVGPNGCGKTSLVRVLVGELNTTQGEAYINKNLRIGYFAQHMVEELPTQETAVQVLLNHVNGLSELDARQHLGTMGISGRTAVQPCEQLSGGQKSRVVLARETLSRPQALILDEPTNHLDMITIDALAEAIQGYNGCVIVVSHDVSFLMNACEELWTVQKGKVNVLYRPATDPSEQGAAPSVAKDASGATDGGFVDAMQAYLKSVRID